MKQVNLGSQGLRVPAIGLGCMGMSEFYGSSSEAQNLRVLDRAADIGCTFWDTSDMYGPFTNEVLLSKALKGRRDQITLATKFGVSRGEDGSWQGIKGECGLCKGLLRRLTEAPRNGLHRSLLSASCGPRNTDRGNGRCHGRAREGGESTLHRPVRGRPGNHRPRPRRFIRSVHSRPSIRCGRGTSRPRFCRQFDDSTSALWLTAPLAEDSCPGQFGHEAIWNPETGG